MITATQLMQQKYQGFEYDPPPITKPSQPLEYKAVFESLTEAETTAIQNQFLERFHAAGINPESAVPNHGKNQFEPGTTFAFKFAATTDRNALDEVVESVHADNRAAPAKTYQAAAGQTYRPQVGA